MISAGGRNLHINKSNSPMSAQSSATGRLPGALNIQNTTGTGATQNWAQDFRQQQTGSLPQAPFNPDFDGPNAMLPNGPVQQSVGAPPLQPQAPQQPQTQPVAGGFGVGPNALLGAMWGGQPQGGGQTGQAATSPFQGDPAGSNYMDAIGGMASSAGQAPVSTPEQDVVRAQQQATQQQAEQERQLRQAFEFFNNPNWAKPEGGLSAIGSKWGWQDASAGYAGNPYITDDQRKSAYEDYRKSLRNNRRGYHSSYRGPAG